MHNYVYDIFLDIAPLVLNIFWFCDYHLKETNLPYLKMHNASVKRAGLFHSKIINIQTKEFSDMRSLMQDYSRQYFMSRKGATSLKN